MKTWAIIDAEIEAKRFLIAIKKLRIVFNDEQLTVEKVFASKHTARLKRASMDLSRALSVMRRQ
jgi:hypothetical protein